MKQNIEELIELINKLNQLIEMIWTCSEIVSRGTTKQNLLWAGICARNSREKLMVIIHQETGLEISGKEYTPPSFVSIRECSDLCEKIITEFSLLDVTKKKLKPLYTSADLLETKKWIEKANLTHK